MASSRVFLLLALVAVLLCGAFAQKTAKYGAGKAKFAEKKCVKKTVGCVACTDDETEGVFVCSECKTPNYVAEPNEDGGCDCDVDNNYGKLTKAQYKAYKSGGYKVKTYGKHAKWGNCVDCTAFGLVADIATGDCVEDSD